MPLLVMKFGGTSVASLDRIRRAAKRVGREVAKGYDVIVIVSAMSGKTNELEGWVEETSKLYDAREYDAVVSSGEQVTAGLMALTLQEMDVPARSWQGWQVPLKTNSAHASARIEEIGTDAINAKFAEGMKVAGVAGFQGISPEGRVTTLGRGGSDTTAVAVACSIGADVCEIYTDVDGVFTTDPNLVPQAGKLGRVSYEEMLEMASLGAKVLQIRSVKFAMQYSCPIHVRSSFHDGEGTWVVREEEVMEELVVSGVTYNRDEAKIRVVGVKDAPGVAAGLLLPFSDAGIVVDMIVQNVSQDGSTDLTFTVPRSDYDAALGLAKSSASAVGAKDVEGDTRIAKVSVVGMGMKDHAGVAARMFQVLGDEGINIQLITTSEIKISVLIEEKYTELAVRALHAAFVESGAGDPAAEG